MKLKMWKMGVYFLLKVGLFIVTLLEINLIKCVMDLKKFIFFDLKILSGLFFLRKLWEVWERFVYKEFYYSMNYKSKNIGKIFKSLIIRERLFKFYGVYIVWIL